MRQKTLRLILCALLSVGGIKAVVAQDTAKAALAPPAAISPADKAAIQVFEKQVKEYVVLCNKAKANAPKLSKDSTPEQIQAYRTALELSLRNARPNAKRGDVFRPETAA